MSESVENFCLRWNDFGSNISQSFHELRQDSDFFDVTLATSDSGERTLRAHKVILSACSTFFKALLKKQAILNPNNMPLIYLRGVTYNDLSALLDFMYQGEVNVGREDLDSFLAVGEELEVKGLTPKDREKHLSNHSDLLNSTFQKAKKGPVTDRLQNFNLGKWNAKVEPRDMNYGVEKGFRPDSNSLESNDEAVVNEAFEGYCSDFYNDDEGTDNRRESFNTPDKGIPIHYSFSKGPYRDLIIHSFQEIITQPITLALTIGITNKYVYHMFPPWELGFPSMVQALQPSNHQPNVHDKNEWNTQRWSPR